MRRNPLKGYAALFGGFSANKNARIRLDPRINFRE